MPSQVNVLGDALRSQVACIERLSPSTQDPPVNRGQSLKAPACNMSPFLIPERWAWFVDFAGKVAVDDPYKRVGEIGVGIDTGKLPGLNQRGDDGPVLPTAIPMRERLADRLGELTLPTDEGALFAQPRVEFVEKRTRSFLADGASLVPPAATNVGFHPIQRGDALQRLVGDGRRFGDGALVEAAPQMRPAEAEADVTFVCKRAIASVPLDLKDALEAARCAIGWDALSCPLTSSSIRCSAPLQHGQVLSSTRVLMRGS